MNKSQIIFITLSAVLMITIWGLIENIESLSILGHVLLLPLIGIWYGFLRDWRTTSVDVLVYWAFIIGSPSDFIIFILKGQVGEFLQINFTLLMHLLLILAFRTEGTTIYSSKLNDIPKIALPMMVVFLTFGHFMLSNVSDAIYFTSMIYAIVLVLFVIHGYFRPFKGRNYWWVALGITLVLVKDILYILIFFIYSNLNSNLYIIQYVISVSCYLCIAYGIAISHTDNMFHNQQMGLLDYFKFNLRNAHRKNSPTSSFYGN